MSGEASRGRDRAGSGGEPTVSYADAGVDLEAADEAVERLSGVLERSRRPEVLGGIGGFGGLFAFPAERFDEPVLVSSTDGVGTKVELARRLDVLETIGQDLVAMVVNDLVVSGAEPLFFNDYLVVGQLEPDRVTRIVTGISEGCRVAGCALVGGETAEHPGLLGPDEFDLAGFGVGVVEQDELLGPHRVRDGDVLVALASSGVHSNGFSLVRRVVEGLDLGDDHGLGRPLGEVLLTPTRIYVADCREIIDRFDVHALCHVTGGGIVGNLPRVLPPELGADVDAATWERPAVFTTLQKSGPVAEEDMWRTFNLGVGMIAAVPPGEADAVVAVLERRGTPAWIAGRIRSGSGVDVVGGDDDATGQV